MNAKRDRAEDVAAALLAGLAAVALVYAIRRSRRWVEARVRTARRLAALERLRVRIQATKRLKKVFDDRWFKGVRQTIFTEGYERSLSMPARTAFIGYFQDAILGPGGPDFIDELDQAFDAIGEAAEKELTNKLRLAAGNHDDYVSTVFETLVVGRFASRHRMVAYEPQNNTRRPEAKVTLGDQDVIVEARATLDEPFRRPQGAYSPDVGARKLAGKIEEKYEQLTGVRLPTLLFLGLNVNLHFEDAEVTRALQRIGACAKSAPVSGIVLADHFRGSRYRLWTNPQAAMPLSTTAQAALARVLGLK